MTCNKLPLEFFSSVEIKKPSDIIITRIRDLIRDGVLKPGDRLPSERVLSERMNISRGYIREAIRQLEFYGILVTLPQKGTFVSSLGVRALEGMITNVLHLEKDDTASLMEIRELLETHAARLAAERRSEEQLEELEQLQRNFISALETGGDGFEDNLIFHLKLAEVCANSILMSLISLITPDILGTLRRECYWDRRRSAKTIEEHEAVLQAVREGDSEKAAEAMANHMYMTINMHG